MKQTCPSCSHENEVATVKWDCSQCGTTYLITKDNPVEVIEKG